MTRFRSTSLARATHGRWCILGRSVPHGTGIPALFGLAVVLFFLASVTVTLQSGAQEAEIPGPPDAPTSQPVVFSHRLHVTDIGLDCQFCHAYARRGPVAGLPSVARCAGCHNVVLPGNPEIERVLLIGVAFLTLVAVLGRDRLRLHDYIGSGQLHDVGKLLFGFCILWAYMLWSQYLVIWYADLPEETAFVARRMSGEWATFTWLAIGLAFVVPFVVLLSRRVKTSTHGLGTVALAALVGMWVERFVLVSPSLWRGDGVPLGIPEVLITGGILSVFRICYTTFLQTFPVLAVSDPRLLKDA